MGYWRILLESHCSTAPQQLCLNRHPLMKRFALGPCHPLAHDCGGFTILDDSRISPLPVYGTSVVSTGNKAIRESMTKERNDGRIDCVWRCDYRTNTMTLPGCGAKKSWHGADNQQLSMQESSGATPDLKNACDAGVWSGLPGKAFFSGDLIYTECLN